MVALSSIMGVVAVEQFAHFTDEEVAAIYQFLREGWNSERAAREEAKIPELYRAKYEAME
jgi:hypothetical protein